MMFLARMGSLNALEQTKPSPFWRKTLGGALPSADTVARVACQLDPTGLRQIIAELYGSLKRKKALPAPWHGLIALVLDGHESTASYRRRCPACLKRTIRTAEGDRCQYYHRYVAASLVGEGFHVFLDAEPIVSGEDEVAAAIRLLRRVHLRFSRAYDLVVADSLYPREDFFKAVLDLGKDVLTVLKQEDRQLMKEARALMEMTTAQRLEAGATAYQCWDVDGVTSWSSLGRPVRVVRTLETTRTRRQATRAIEEQTSEWIWVTTLSPARARTKAVVEIGHSRWDIENKGFNEAVNEWHLDHVYRHDPTAMMTLLLLGMIAYNLYRAFYSRDLKPRRRARESMRHVAQLMAADIYGEISSRANSP